MSLNIPPQTMHCFYCGHPVLKTERHWTCASWIFSGRQRAHLKCIYPHYITNGWGCYVEPEERVK